MGQASSSVHNGPELTDDVIMKAAPELAALITDLLLKRSGVPYESEEDATRIIGTEAARTILQAILDFGNLVYQMSAFELGINPGASTEWIALAVPTVECPPRSLPHVHWEFKGFGENVPAGLVKIGEVGPRLN